MSKNSRIVCAAIRDSKGTVVLGARHYDKLMHAAIDAMPAFGFLPVEQGFIDQFGAYWNRTNAWRVAEAAGQILHRCGGDAANGGTLYSENLY